MSQNQSAIKPALLLAGFVLMSILIHSIFLAARFDEQPKSVNILQVAPPLQVVVISSHGSKTDEPQKAKPIETVKRTPVDRTTSVVSAKPTTRTTRVKELTAPEPVQTRQEPKHVTDKKQTPSVSSTKLNTASDVKRKPASVNHLRAQLHSYLAQHFIYPRLARRMGWEGQVSLGLHIEEDGSLQKIHVVRSSGYKVLDENAQSTLRSIGRITVASNMTIDPVDTEIEVLYRLTD